MKRLLTIVIATTLLTACGFWKTEKPEEKAPEKTGNTYIIDAPYGMESLNDEIAAPEIYAIVATRAANKMLDQTRNIYDTSNKSVLLHINNPKKTSDDLPNGFYLSQKVTRQIIQGSKSYTVVNNIKDADYYLEALISKIEIEGQDTPILQYKLMMFDRKDKKVGEWIEVIRKIRNDDRSWL